MTANWASASFKSTGSTTSRTEGDRAADIKNVKDFGAIGDGFHDDTNNIQAAIDWQTSTSYRGEIFFPPGTYKITQALSINVTSISVVLRGSGSATLLSGNFNDYIIKKQGSSTSFGIRIIESMKIVNGHATGGGVQMLGCVGAVIRDCYIEAYQGVDLSISAESSMSNVQVAAPAGTPSGSKGILLGGNDAIFQCDIIGFDEGVRAHGAGHSIIGCRFEVNNTGILLGKDASGATDGVQGAFICGGTFEANDTAINCVAAGSTHFSGFLIQGTPGSPSGGSLDGIVIGNSGASDCRFSCISAAGGFTNYAFTLGNNLDRCSFSSCKAVNDGTGTWSISQSAGAQFDGSCNIPAPATQTYANRPTSPSEGCLWIFTDSSTATFGDPISGSGANRVVGRFSANTSVWTVVAKAP